MLGSRVSQGSAPGRDFPYDRWPGVSAIFARALFDFLNLVDGSVKREQDFILRAAGILLENEIEIELDLVGMEVGLLQVGTPICVFGAMHQQ